MNRSGKVMITGPGGTYRHMHDVLDGLSPHAAVQAVEHEFPGWHLHEDRATGTVWADTDHAPGIGPPIPLREPDAEHMWQAISATEYRWHLAAAGLHGHPGVAA
jgi:hypothetical protein